MEESDMTTILVLGGTGLLGQPVVERLLLDGFEVRLLARDPEKARSIVQDSADIVAGDAIRVDDVERAMEGCQGVHISVGGPADQASAETVAAVAAGKAIQRITYLSGSTVAERHRWFPMVAQKLAAEEALRACPVPSTILCPTWPMEQLPRFVREGRATVIGDQPTPLHWFASADLARMVSNAFQREEAADTRLYVHGPQGLPMRNALERFCRAEHPDIQVTTLPIEAARAAAKTSGDPAFGFVVEMMAYFDRAGELGDSEEADRLLGPNTITLDRWLAEQSGTSPEEAP
jgi:uncharacterized protein YbjT (DUF2867 family)